MLYIIFSRYIYDGYYRNVLIKISNLKKNENYIN